MPPGKEKASMEEEEDILQAVILADSFNSRFGPLTMDLPRILLPVCNTPLLDWTLEALASAGVQQVYVFCCSHAKLIREAIHASPWSRPSSGLKIIPIYSKEARSVGDAIREIDAKQIISSDFVLVSGDIISNIRIEDVVKEHRERRKINKDAIMTSVVREVGPRDRPRPGGDATVLVIDSDTSQLVHYEYVSAGKATFDLPAEIVAKHTDLDVRIDLIDCGIDICTPDVPALFTENFDYQDLRKDFVRGVLTSDLLSKTIHCHIVTKGYAARVKDTRMYGAISKDIIARRTFPLVPDDNHLGGDMYELRRGHIYVSKKGVTLSRTCQIGNHTIIGSNCEIMNSVRISSSVLGRNCEVGNRTEIRDSYIWEGSKIGADCFVEESIIGANVRILDGTHIKRGCLVGKGVQLGPNAILERFQRVSRHKPEPEEEEAEEAEGSDEEQSVAESRATTHESEASVDSDMVSVLGNLAKAYLWPDEDKAASDAEEDIESLQTRRLGRLGDHGSDIELDESEDSDVETVGSSPMGSPLSASSATSAGISINVPSLNLDSSPDFLSECRQSIERAYEEDHTIENASIELKTLRMASNVPLIRVAECIIDFLIEKIELVEAAPAQRAKVNNVIVRWGPVLKGIGWKDAVETIFVVQRYCARHRAYQKIFGLILASFYNEDITEFDDIKGWYAKVLAMKKAGLGPNDVLAASLEDSMQQAMRLLQQIHDLEADDDDDSEDEDENGEEDGPDPKATPSKPSQTSGTEEEDEDEEED